jgi:outer membrane receptor protein involved in Fe transport
LRVFGEVPDTDYCLSAPAVRRVRHTLLGVRFGLARGPWSVELWGSNLTDANYIRAVASRPRSYFPLTVQPQDLIYGDGRRVGLDVRWRF